MNSYTNNFSTRGFTLIELLVVIAIIGILSSVVLANVNQARQKGNDVAIKAQYAQIRTSAELYYSNYGTYGGGATGVAAVVSSSTCTGAGTVFNQTDGIGKQLIVAEANSDQTPTWVSRCALSSTPYESWAVSIPLKGGTNWCVDSSGYLAAGTSTGGGAARAYCQ